MLPLNLRGEHYMFLLTVSKDNDTLCRMDGGNPDGKHPQLPTD
jgi:hypothetical protein